MRALITGGGGFIGRSLICKLEEVGHEIINADISEGIDIINWDCLMDLPNFDIAFHLAAKSYVPSSYNNPREFYEVNCFGTLNVIELCRHNNAKLVYLSSYVYGKPDYLPVDEKHPVKPFNPYAQTKIIGEKICEGYNRDFHIPVVIVRPFNIYGANQNNSFIIPHIINQLKNSVIQIENPIPKRDYVYLDDLISFLKLLIEYDDDKLQVFNIASNKSYSVLELAQFIINISNSKSEIVVTNNARINEIMDTRGSFQKANDILGWEPKYDIISGLKSIL